MYPESAHCQGLRRRESASLPPSVTVDDIAAPAERDPVALLRGVLDGEAGAARDVVLLNAGVALYAANVAPSMAEGVASARDAVASGKALAKMHQFVARTRELAPA